MEQPQPNKDLPERLLKYLPALMFGHLFITIPAFVISLALAYATFVQADATHKIQQSETWPYVSYGTSNTNEGKPEISFNLTNGGVGPAKLVAMQFTYRGRPMASPREFLKSCCAGATAAELHELAGQWRASAWRAQGLHPPGQGPIQRGHLGHPAPARAPSRSRSGSTPPSPRSPTEPGDRHRSNAPTNIAGDLDGTLATAREDRRAAGRRRDC